MEVNEQLIRAITEAVAKQLYANDAPAGQGSGGVQSWTVQDDAQEAPGVGQSVHRELGQNSGQKEGRDPAGSLARGDSRSGTTGLAGKTRMRPKHSYEGAERAKQGTDPKEIVIGVGAAFQTEINATIGGIPLDDVLRNVRAGIEEEGMTSRVVKVLDTSDVCFMALQSAKLSGSGIGIGIQSKGTTVIHQKDLYPLTNLELFPQAPLMNLETYRRIGKNAAKYVKGEKVTPIECTNDPMVRAKYQVKAALMHIIETEQLDPDRGMIVWEGAR